MKHFTWLSVILVWSICSNFIDAQILTISPDSVVQGEELTIEITAKNINFSQGTNTVTFKQGNVSIYTDSPTVKNSTTLRVPSVFSSDKPIGYYDVIVRNVRTDVSFTKTSGVYVSEELLSAELWNFEPKSAAQGDTITLMIYAKHAHFDSKQYRTTVYLSNGGRMLYARSVTAINSDALEAKFIFDYSHSVGEYSVFVQNQVDGVLTQSEKFKLEQGAEVPKIVSVTPSEARQGDLLDIVITTENIDFSQASSTIYFKQDNQEVRVSSYVKQSDKTTLSIKHAFNKDYLTGLYDLYIYNPNGYTAVKEGAIMVSPDLTPAKLEMIKPNNAKQGDTIVVTLHAKNANFNASNIKNIVYLDGEDKRINPVNITPIDEETLNAEFMFNYSHPIGLYTVVVSNIMDGTLRLDTFEIAKGPKFPRIVELSPDTMIVGETLDVVVTAENIDFSQGSNVVSFTQGDTHVLMNSTQITSKTSLKLNVSIDEKAPEGLYNLLIYNTSFDVTLLKDYTLTEERRVYFKAAKIKNSAESIQEDNRFFYPNPASDFLYIQKQYEVVELYNMNGQKVLETRLTTKINVSQLPKGVYVVKLLTHDKVQLSKLQLK